MLQQKMKPRHLQMIAVGESPRFLGLVRAQLTSLTHQGSIGTGLFIGTGQALRNGGPGGILIAWSLIGIMLINVTQCLGEMCIMYPVSGGELLGSARDCEVHGADYRPPCTGFYTLAVRFLDPGFGLALGYNYLFQASEKPESSSRTPN